jgi:hypothetical protein
VARKIIVSEKDANGIYTKQREVVEPPALPEPELSLDDIAKRVIQALERATKHLLEAISKGDVDRDTIGALKDCASVLKDLRKDEKELLESLSDEDLEKVAKR